MNDPVPVAFSIDADRPVDRAAVVSALAAVLISADRRRRVRANTEIAAGVVPADNLVRAGGSARTGNDRPASWR